MKHARSLFTGFAALAWSACASGPSPAAAIRHPFLCTDSYGGSVSLVSADGQVLWQYKCTHPQDCWALPNGDFLFCHLTGVIEINPQREIVWQDQAGPRTEVHACQPLPDGRVLAMENGPCRIIEIDREGKIAKEIKLPVPPRTVALHDQFRGVRKTADGHYYVCAKGEHKVMELDSDGKILRTIPVPGDVHECLLLPDRHLLIDCGDGHKIIELDENEKVVWEIDEHDLPGNPLRLVAGCERLPNGDTVFCNYLGHDHLADPQPHVFEVTRDKKVVWEFSDKEHFKTINQIQLLDVPGDVTKGQILR